MNQDCCLMAVQVDPFQSHSVSLRLKIALKPGSREPFFVDALLSVALRELLEDGFGEDAYLSIPHQR